MFSKHSLKARLPGTGLVLMYFLFSATPNKNNKQKKRCTEKHLVNKCKTKKNATVYLCSHLKRLPCPGCCEKRSLQSLETLKQTQQAAFVRLCAGAPTEMGKDRRVSRTSGCHGDALLSVVCLDCSFVPRSPGEGVELILPVDGRMQIIQVPKMGAFTRSYIFFFRTEQGRFFCTGKGKNNFHFQTTPSPYIPLSIVLRLLGTTRVKRQRKRHINTHDIYLRRASSARSVRRPFSSNLIAPSCSGARRRGDRVFSGVFEFLQNGMKDCDALHHHGVTLLSKL